MENIVEKLKEYFETTSEEKVLKDWDNTKEFDQVGPTMDDFLNHTQWHLKIKLDDPMIGQNLVINNYSPKFSSGFFFNNSVKTCNKPHFQL